MATILSYRRKQQRQSSQGHKQLAAIAICKLLIARRDDNDKCVFMLHRDNNDYIFTLITREQAKTSSNKLNGINQRMIIPLNCLVNNQLQPSRECASAGARHSRVDGQQRHHRL